MSKKLEEMLPPGNREVYDYGDLERVEIYVNSNKTAVYKALFNKPSLDPNEIVIMNGFLAKLRAMSKSYGVKYESLVASVRQFFFPPLPGTGIPYAPPGAPGSPQVKPIPQVVVEDQKPKTEAQTSSQELTDPSKIVPGKTYELDYHEHRGTMLDGDTLYIGPYKIRMAGVDAPESDQQPLASKALEWAIEWFESNPKLNVKFLKKDKYGRQVAVVSSKETGEVFNLALIQNGYAFFNRQYPDVGDGALQGRMKNADDSLKERWKQNPDDKYQLYSYSQPSDWRYNNPDIKAHNRDVMRNNAKVNDAGLNKTADDSTIPWKEDKPIEGSSRYDNLKGTPTIGHLSRLYDYYYTSADVKVWLVSDTGRRVMVDLLAGIGYNFNVNTVPVYTIGSRFPVFFTRGNVIGNGALMVPFKNAFYLKNMLQYIFDEYTPTPEERDASRAEDKAIENMTDEEIEHFKAKSYRGTDIIDIGAVVSTFDIEIRFDNSNAFQRDGYKSNIVLKDCKLVGDSTDVASARDGALHQSYNFLFRNVISTS